jgi:prophage antirepressor-like protein
MKILDFIKQSGVKMRVYELQNGELWFNLRDVLSMLGLSQLRGHVKDFREKQPLEVSELLVLSNRGGRAYAIGEDNQEQRACKKAW